MIIITSNEMKFFNFEENNFDFGYQGTFENVNKQFRPAYGKTLKTRIRIKIQLFLNLSTTKFKYGVIVKLLLIEFI